MSLINKALKKAQTRVPPQDLPQTPFPKRSDEALSHPSLHTTGKGKGRWYLIALLLAPAMVLPILTSKWSREKRHFREEIAVLTSTPIPPVAKHDFRPTKPASMSTTAEMALSQETQGIADTAPQSGRTRGSREDSSTVTKFINQSRISSVRAAGKNSKIVINNRTVPLDSYINDELPVRVSKVSTHEVVFTDDYGHEYHKQF